MKKALRNVYRWMDERVQLKTLVDFMGKKYVPVHRKSVWYYFGGVSLFLFIIQVVTGIMLLLYYKGSEQLAFESIQFIMSKVEFGWLVRSIHSWAANLFILAAVVHMFSVLPQASNSRSPLSSPYTSVGGRKSATLATRSARIWHICSWFFAS